MPAGRHRALPQRSRVVVRRRRVISNRDRIVANRLRFAPQRDRFFSCRICVSSQRGRVVSFRTRESSHRGRTNTERSRVHPQRGRKGTGRSRIYPQRDRGIAGGLRERPVRDRVGIRRDRAVPDRKRIREEGFREKPGRERLLRAGLVVDSDCDGVVPDGVRRPHGERGRAVRQGVGADGHGVLAGDGVVVPHDGHVVGFPEIVRAHRDVRVRRPRQGEELAAERFKVDVRHDHARLGIERPQPGFFDKVATGRKRHDPEKHEYAILHSPFLQAL